MQKQTTIEKNNPQSGIKLIAKLANVSIGTVDRVLHNRPGVAQETRGRVLKVIEELNYKPNLIARRLVSRKKYTFAVLIPQTSKENPYWSLHEAGIKKAEEELFQLGIFIDLLHFDQSDPASFEKKVNQVISGNYDGVLLVPFFLHETIHLLKDCQDKKIPFVFFDTNLQSNDYKPLSFIGQNAYQSGYFAGKFVSYLLSGEETVLVVSINIVKKADNHVNYMQRAEGFKNFANETRRYKLKQFEYNNLDEHNFELLEKNLMQTLAEDPSIKVIFVTNSRAYMVAAILEKHQLKNLRIIGYDLVERNVHYLKNGIIDFLLSQEPFHQGYQGIMTLYNHLVLTQPADEEKFLPITLITKENLDYYI